MGPASTPLSGCSQERSDQAKSFQKPFKTQHPRTSKTMAKLHTFLRVSMGFLRGFYGMSTASVNSTGRLRFKTRISNCWPVPAQKNVRNTLIANNANVWSDKSFCIGWPRWPLQRSGIQRLTFPRTEVLFHMVPPAFPPHCGCVPGKVWSLALCCSFNHSTRRVYRHLGLTASLSLYIYLWYKYVINLLTYYSNPCFWSLTLYKC